MRTNLRPAAAPRTHEGGQTVPITDPFVELRRAVASCLLWEKAFYESGLAIADRISKLVRRCEPRQVMDLAIAARVQDHLRHVPLLLARELSEAHPAARHQLAQLLPKIIQRADELGEFLALYWAADKASDPRAGRPLGAAIKRGLASALQQFDEYQLAKYDRAAAVRLRDVLFLTHAKPVDEAQAALWKRLAEGQLASPGTWEERLSAGEDKCTVFTELLQTKKLGYLALLRNLRNMTDAGVERQLIRDALLSGATKGKALPFRFLAAARACPQLEPELDAAMQASMGVQDLRLSGVTTVLIDVSGSMGAKVSEKSDLTRMDAASALAILLVGVCAQVRVFTFSNSVVEVPPRRGMALRDAVDGSQPHGGTLLGEAVTTINRLQSDRLIVFTDEESADYVGAATAPRAYMVNVSQGKHAVGYGPWTRVSGFSEGIVRWIASVEAAA